MIVVAVDCAAAEVVVFNTVLMLKWSLLSIKEVNVVAVVSCSDPTVVVATATF